MNDRFPFVRTFMISAERGYGVDALREWLAAEMPEGPWLYPEDQIADLPMRMIAAEMTREKLTLRLHEELPYQLTVETEAWEERPDGSVRIDQVDLRRPRRPQGHPPRQEGRDDQGHRPARPRRDRGVPRPQGAPLPAGEGPPELARRGRALHRDGPRLLRRGVVTRLTTDFWVAAYLNRLRLSDIPAFVVAKGDATAGAVLVKQNTLDGRARVFQRSFDLMSGARAWIMLTEGDEAEVDASIARQRAFDRDLWVIEVEDRDGRHLLDEPGLSS